MPNSSKIHCFRSTSGENIDRKCRQKVEKDVEILNLHNWPCQKHFPATSGQSGSHQKFRRKISGGVLGVLFQIRPLCVAPEVDLGSIGCVEPLRIVTVNETSKTPTLHNISLNVPCFICI